MRVLGGFAGHGRTHAVTVDAKTLRRRCGDCQHSWSSDEDGETRTLHVCLAAREKEELPATRGQRT